MNCVGNIPSRGMKGRKISVLFHLLGNFNDPIETVHLLISELLHLDVS